MSKHRRTSAFSVVLFRHFAPDPMAIVPIGIAIASAHRPIQLKTKLSDFHAGPRTVCRPALSRIAIAPEPRTAPTPDRAVASCPDPGCVCNVHATKQRKYACRGDNRYSVRHRLLRGASPPRQIDRTRLDPMTQHQSMTAFARALRRHPRRSVIPFQGSQS